ncbi:hypothetical protein JW859_02970 [bacterium]|nr:hypothetical protein [bacterium]
MAECECLAKCPFFNDKMQGMDGTATMVKRRYCLDNYENCARYIVFKQLGREKVPADLFPIQKDRLPAILAQTT